MGIETHTYLIKSIFLPHDPVTERFEASTTVHRTVTRDGVECSVKHTLSVIERTPVSALDTLQGALKLYGLVKP